MTAYQTGWMDDELSIYLIALTRWRAKPRHWRQVSCAAPAPGHLHMAKPLQGHAQIAKTIMMLLGCQHCFIPTAQT